MKRWSGFLLSVFLCLDLGLVNVAALRTALAELHPLPSMLSAGLFLYPAGVTFARGIHGLL